MPTTLPATKAETVVIRGGLSVPLAALRVLWDLEARGFTLTAADDGLIIAPRSRLTADDDRAIRRHRDELIALLRYCETIQ
jgi:hypothetical protein